MKKKIISFLFFVSISILIFAQYNGGSYDGYAKGEFETEVFDSFSGGSYDGYALGEGETEVFTQFDGGSYDGYAKGEFETDVFDSFSGGSYDGFALGESEETSLATTAVKPPLQDLESAYNASSNPYVVSTLGHLSWLAQNSSGWDKAYKQTGTIDATQTQYWDDADDGSDGDKYNDSNDLTSTGNNEGFSPIGNSTTKFTGTYIGQEYKIDGLFIDRSTTNNVGFIGYTDNADIDNLGVTNVDITGQYQVGGLVGNNLNSTISTCFATGSVTGSGGNAGGLNGVNDNSTIDNSYSTSSITGTNSDIGGLVGYNKNSSVINKCYATGSATGNYSVGGLVGLNKDSSVNNSYATGSITGNNNHVGGLIGCNDSSTLSDSYATGSVDGSGENTGGLVGDNRNSGTPSTVNKSYATGSVSGSTNTGGLVGNNSSSTVSNSFWDTETTGQSSSDGGTGKTTTQMKTESTYTDAGWDFTVNAEDDDWRITPTLNNGYPHLIWAETLDPALPVTLSSFTVSYSKNLVVLKWTTQSETDNLGFNLFRSENENGFESEDFIQINSSLIDGQGTSTEPTNYSFTDEYAVIEGHIYWYWLQSVSTTNELELFGPVSITIPFIGQLPTMTILETNYPNPFNPETTIAFEIKEHEIGVLGIYNLRGQRILKERFESGVYQYHWNAMGFASGIYFYKLSSPTINITKKMLLIK